MSLENVSLSKEAITGASSKIFANALSDNLFKDNSGELDGGIIGNIFSSGVGSATNTIANNVMKGLVLTSGLGRNVGTSLASSGVGIASNYIGQGIDSLGGHSMLSRGVGQGVATGLGTIGGLAVSNLIKYGTFAGKATNGSKAALIGKGAGSINPYGLAATVAGTALGAAFGPSKEYKGKYGSITQTMDTVYDGVTAAANFIPGWGQLASGFMTLNKGLSNIFGSTSGMTVQDAILGSAFMPAPVKWLNMANAKTTGGVDNYSWLNQEKLGGFMGDAFGDTWSKINKAVDESGKTYGTFSNSAYKDAQGNINYVNSIYNPLLAMANQNEYQGIRAFDMDTINNLRYSQWIQGGFKPITVGKRGMKILNNATNHNIGMRLLSAAALIDNKQMILSAQGGTKVARPPRMRAHRKGDESRGLTQEEQEWWRLHEEEQKRLLEEETAKKIKEKEEAADKFNQQTNTVMGAMTLLANETPFTGLEYQQTAENLRQKKVEKFHEAEKIGEAALMADLAVNAAPLLLRGFRWAFNKAGLLVKVPVLKTIQLKSGITKSVLDNGKIRLSLPSHTDNKPRQFVLEPARDAGDNKYYVHMRMWDDVENKVPASNVTNEEKQQLFDALYDELPEGAEILFPKSGPGNYGTRGTVVGLQRLSRDPRFTPGTKGILLYLDKDGKTVRTYEGTSFIKAPRTTSENAASMTPEQWTAAQDAAIARGDMAEAQRLRDLHAHTKGYNSTHSYHGTTNGNYNSIDFSKSDDGRSYFTTESYDTAKTYAGEDLRPSEMTVSKETQVPIIDKNDNIKWSDNIEDLKAEGFDVSEQQIRDFNNGKEVTVTRDLSKIPSPIRIFDYYTKFDNPFILENKVPTWWNKLQLNGKEVTTREISEYAANNGHDSVIITNVNDMGPFSTAEEIKSGVPNIYTGTLRVAHRPGQVKLADAVTYDNKGIRIPLGERDNFNINDIRYGLLPFLGLGTTAATLYNKSK